MYERHTPSWSGRRVGLVICGCLSHPHPDQPFSPLGFLLAVRSTTLNLFLVNTSLSTGSFSHVVFSRLEIHHGVIVTNLAQHTTNRGTLSGREAFPTRVFLLVGFDEASISQRLKKISWEHGRLGTAVWKWKESIGGNRTGRT
ncbi:hypothetical protein PITC_077700 [Penicillium italicum]|uniref:Uncharacterized protein n=1 Tax=Penicillium italicum TaxID=40296 RepID=A0A0A2KPX2_PENIT|nr:hypothetical protein PITC_077700 [Penicillium italicum]